MKVHNVNTGKIIEARIQTPRGEVHYQGDASIDGVPGGAAVKDFLISPEPEQERARKASIHRTWGQLFKHQRISRR